MAESHSICLVPALLATPVLTSKTEKHWEHEHRTCRILYSLKANKRVRLFILDLPNIYVPPSSPCQTCAFLGWCLDHRHHIPSTGSDPFLLSCHHPENTLVRDSAFKVVHKNSSPFFILHLQEYCAVWWQKVTVYVSCPLY